MEKQFQNTYGLTYKEYEEADYCKDGKVVHQWTMESKYWETSHQAGADPMCCTCGGGETGVGAKCASVTGYMPMVARNDAWKSRIVTIL